MPTSSILSNATFGASSDGGPQGCLPGTSCLDHYKHQISKQVQARAKSTIGTHLTDIDAFRQKGSARELTTRQEEHAVVLEEISALQRDNATLDLQKIEFMGDIKELKSRIRSMERQLQYQPTNEHDGQLAELREQLQRTCNELTATRKKNAKLKLNQVRELLNVYT
jgi:hypothetical protein